MGDAKLGAAAGESTIRLLADTIRLARTTSEDGATKSSGPSLTAAGIVLLTVESLVVWT